MCRSTSFGAKLNWYREVGYENHRRRSVYREGVHQDRTVVIYIFRANKHGKPCTVVQAEEKGSTILCAFAAGSMEWFPASCVLDDTLLASEPPKTLRDEFAIAAMSGLVFNKGLELTLEDINGCYELADSMMEVRKK